MLLRTESKSAKPPHFETHSREDLRGYFLNTWDLYEQLLSSIREERYFYEAPDPLRHPLIFYLGHTACFYINKLKASGYLKEGINARFETLLAVGVDPESEDKLASAINWPAVKDVWEYRGKVKEIVLDFIDTAPLMHKPDKNSSMWALFMALEHERIHYETSSMLMRQYPIDWLQAPEHWQLAPTSTSLAPEFKMISFPGGQVTLGKPEDCPTYGWDNEFGQLRVEVSEFAIGNIMVANSQFLEFVELGGYNLKEYWTDESWQWKEELSLSAPKFWRKSLDGSFQYRGLYHELPLPGQWPAEVTAYEAAAYLKWKGKGFRLMTEAEWKFASQHAPCVQDDPVFAEGYNHSLAYGSPTPVGFMQNGKTPEGVYDLHGNVWDWLSDNHYPLPGFKVHPWYEDFSEPFMDEEHGMMAGGSWATSGCSASKYYRLWFRRGFFQHAGFRMAQSL